MFEKLAKKLEENKKYKTTKNKQYAEGNNAHWSTVAGGVAPFLSTLPYVGPAAGLAANTLGGALTSPKHYRPEGVAGQFMGTGLGGLAGLAGGGLLGASGGLALAKALDKNKDKQKLYSLVGGLVGGGLGGTAGGAFGANKGRVAMLREAGAFGPDGEKNPTKDWGYRDLETALAGDTPITAPIIGALTSPEGYRGTGALGAFLGNLGGTLGGGALGAGAVNLLARALDAKEKTRQQATIIGGLSGGLLGSSGGSALGRRLALQHANAKNASLRELVRYAVESSSIKQAAIDNEYIDSSAEPVEDLRALLKKRNPFKERQMRLLAGGHLPVMREREDDYHAYYTPYIRDDKSFAIPYGHKLEPRVFNLPKDQSHPIIGGLGALTGAAMGVPMGGLIGGVGGGLLAKGLGQNEKKWSLGGTIAGGALGGLGMGALNRRVLLDAARENDQDNYIEKAIMDLTNKDYAKHLKRLSAEKGK